MDLGDYFVHSGVVNYYADRCQQLHLPVTYKSYDTITCLYSEHPNIITVRLRPEEEQEYVDMHKLSRVVVEWEMIFRFVNGHYTALLWDEQIYTHFELPFSLRYTNFRLPKNLPGSDALFEKLYTGRPYILVHTGTGQHPNGLPVNIENFRLANNLPQDVDIIEIIPSRTSNMLDYVKLIENAAEIHCVNSSFYCLVDGMYHRTRGTLFFHDIRASSIVRVNSEWNNRCWKIVYYPEKF